MIFPDNATGTGSIHMNKWYDKEETVIEMKKNT